MYIFITSVFFLMLFLGMPVSILLGIAGSLTLLFKFSPDVVLNQLALVSYKSINDSVLVAIPLFILTGQVMLSGGMGKRLFDVADKWLRHLPGGIGIATIASCTFFGAISGSSTATAATIGSIALPEMNERKYPKKISIGILAAGGTLGILIPPSLPLIMYSSITEQPVDQLFTSAVIPGILLSLMFMIYVGFVCGKSVPKLDKATWTERFSALKEAFWGLMLPVIILGGTYTGIFTITEAAAIAFVYSLFVCIFIYKTINLNNIVSVLTESGATTGMLLFIVIGAMLFGYGLTSLRLPQQISQFFLGLDTNLLTMMIIVCLLWLVMGFFLEIVSIILISVPILFPILSGLGVDPIWLGIIMVIVMEMGLITPPVGVNLFALQGIDPDSTKLNVFQMGVAVIPYILIMIFEIILLVIFPQLTSWIV